MTRHARVINFTHGPYCRCVPDLGTLGPVALYVAVFALVFAESGILLGFFLPGDTVLLAVGALTASPDRGLSLSVLIAVVLVAAVTGDGVGYWTGARAGAPLLQRDRGRLLNRRNLARATRLYDRHGALAVIAARWIPWLRVLVPVMAGVAGMPYRRFLVANVVGAVLWGAGLLIAGNLLGAAVL